MDERLKKALEFSDIRVNLFNQKENIKLKVDTLRTHSINGGIFKATPDLISFVATPDLISFVATLSNSGYDRVVLIDTNGNPIEITDVSEFYQELLSKYFEATNFYYVEYTKLKRARSVKDQYRELFEDDK